MSRKKLVLFFLLFLCFSCVFVHSGELLGTVGVSKFLDARFGAEYYFSPRWGIKADIGLSFLSDFPDGTLIFTYDVLGVFILSKPGGTFILKALFGAIDGHFFTMSPPIVTVAPGGSLWLGARLGDKFDIGLRLGTGALLQYEQYQFKYDWWFDITLELHYYFVSHAQ
jgi:hypothetical protein